jgi:hypothetical protein
MIAFEVALLFSIGAIVIAAIIKLGKPLADAYAERVRFQYRELGSAAQEKLEKKTDYLESEIMDLKARVKALEESAEFNARQQSAPKLKVDDLDKA